MEQEYGKAKEFGLRLFQRYEYTNSMPEQEKIKIIRAAARLGEQRGCELKAEFCSEAPSQILNMHGIRVLEENGKNGARPNFVKFAELHVKQKRLMLNSQALLLASRKMDRNLVKEIILCHEMYHYFEMIRWGRTRESFKSKVRLFRKIPVTRGILPAEEIAANAFVKAYLNLTFEPYELERLYED